jgi:hypothetical protein
VTGPTSVLLAWSSLTEQNNKFFVIQRGSDSLALSNLDTVPAADSPHNYAFTDTTAPPGTSYYRIYQTDINGNTTFSGTQKAVIPLVLAAQAPSPAPSRLSLRPNPTSGIVILEMTNSLTGNLEIILSDAAGGTLRVWKSIKDNQYWSQTIDPGYLPPGTYYMTVIVNGYREVKPFLRI